MLLNFLPYSLPLLFWISRNVGRRSAWHPKKLMRRRLPPLGHEKWSDMPREEPYFLRANIMKIVIKICGRRGGLVVSALDSGSRGSGSSSGRVTVLCSWARYFTRTLLLSTQEYKWVPMNCQGNLTKCWGVTCDGQASLHPGGVAILIVASCYGNRNNIRQ